jgi:methionine sulfoxide reductase heme-binding subunit
MKFTRIQIIINLISLLPATIICFLLIQDTLSANPIQTVTVVTGRTAIYMLLFSLFCTPLNNIFKMSVFIRIRKTVGLYAFYYSLVHFLIFSVIDYELNLSWILPELTQKPFLQIGLAALTLLLLLALTSLQTIKNTLGIWWKRIHSLVYIITALIIVHIILASKGDIIEAIILMGLFLFAMLWRISPLKKISIQNAPKWAHDLNTFLIQ